MKFTFNFLNVFCVYLILLMYVLFLQMKSYSLNLSLLNRYESIVGCGDIWIESQKKFFYFFCCFFFVIHFYLCYQKNRSKRDIAGEENSPPLTRLNQMKCFVSVISFWMVSLCFVFLLLFATWCCCCCLHCITFDSSFLHKVFFCCVVVLCSSLR